MWPPRLTPGDPCPACGAPLAVQPTAPCDECGATGAALADLDQGRSFYLDVIALDGYRLILCERHWAEFSSYPPSFLGWPDGAAGPSLPEVLGRIVDPCGDEQLACGKCGRREALLRLIREQRARGEPSRAWRGRGPLGPASSRTNGGRRDPS
jgi:hypothetical protein